MVERLGEMRKGRTERIEKREKRERDKRLGLKEITKHFYMDKEHKKVTSTFHDEVIYIIFASHKYNFMIN